MVLERLNVFEVEVKMKVEVEDSLAGMCFTIFDLQQRSVATESLTVSVDLCEIPTHTQTRVNCTVVIKFNLCMGVACIDMNSMCNEPVAER